MGDYAHTTTINQDPDKVFTYLSDVANLPEYFEAMQSAEQAEGEAVYVVALVEGVARKGEAWFRVDAGSRSLAWGAEGSNNYNGELSVEPADDGSSVTVTLHTENVDGPGITAGLTGTLANIKRILDGSSTGSAA
ncbi:polyketide cyclase/dehydrase/lipid transport protein [Pseudonocardia sediminis]|uniref:Polyketide cyclase/dehydrase/lipid transport protein n=1 Tax=Pseudonocardia sediminis TaxID=1397368 RepID=A0A4Q7V1P2_PSEST|nr:SRPBCC family protein [Pseudonocardia sediminis]RZT87241.1 polyketide cyclase/dehydrase/lipid transport protein [Pseudonocardia sediminis]